MGKKHKKGKAVKNNHQIETAEPEELKRAPHSFVIHRGVVGSSIMELSKDFRKVMEPFTASSLKARKKNLIKDFVSVAGLLHVSHMCIFTRTELGPYIKIARLPRGPTLTFRVHNYTLARNVVSSLRRQFVFQKQFEHAPLVVLNSFSNEEKHLKLVASMFQNMFPTINLSKVNLNNIRRCVLLNYNSESRLMDFRHYAIKVVPVGLSRGVKKLVTSKVPNLSRFNDISEFLTNSAQLSESEVEDDPASHVTLPQNLSSRGNVAAGQSAIRLIELGPRLSLQLIKVEGGLLDGEVMFHELVEKTEEECLLIKKKREAKKKLKEKRRKLQEDNKMKKGKVKEEMKMKSLEGMKKTKPLENDILMQKAVLEGIEATDKTEDDDDDDAAWYQKEVGKEPDRDLFPENSKFSGGKRKQHMNYNIGRKKLKLDSDKWKKKQKQANEFQSTKYQKGEFKNKSKKFGNKATKFDQKFQRHKGKVFGSKVKSKRR